MPALNASPVKIRVLCVDDNEDIPLMLGRCIAAEPDMESAGSLNTVENLRGEVERTRADVVLLDLKIPGSDPLAAMVELSEPSLSGSTAPRRTVHVIAYSGRDDDASVKRAATAGASAYLSKDAPIPHVLDAIREAARGAPFRVWRATH
jgi:DNA-binding NarL/FixJ family response regulator